MIDVFTKHRGEIRCKMINLMKLGDLNRHSTICAVYWKRRNPENRYTYLRVWRPQKWKKWFDPNSKTVPMANELVLIAIFFGCSTDYLLDLIG